MSVLSVIFVIMTIALPIFFFISNPKSPYILITIACIIHIVSVFLQDNMLKTIPGDAHLYYYDLDNYMYQPLRIGTSLVVYSTMYLKNLLNAEFIDLMLLYGFFGALSVVLLINYIHSTVPKNARLLPYCLCFLPGLHFWTSFIGKDAIISLGITLAVTALPQLPKSMIRFVIGLCIIAIIRTHILVIFVAIFIFIKMTLENDGKNRMAILLFSAASIPALNFALDAFIGINLFDFNSISLFFEERQSYATTEVGNGVLYIENPMIRILYFMSNPFFFNTTNFFGVVASIENLMLLSLIIRLIWIIKKIKISEISSVIFLSLLILTLSIFLGITGYNVGLALRHKVMLYPAFIVLSCLLEKQLSLHNLDQLKNASNNINIGRY